MCRNKIKKSKEVDLEKTLKMLSFYTVWQVVHFLYIFFTFKPTQMEITALNF